MTAKQLLTSKSEHWCTPPDFLDVVEELDSIGLDPCSNACSVVNAKKAMTKSQDGLSIPWTGHGLVYCNPPYGRKLKIWVHKAWEEAQKGAEIVLLTPARTDTKYFHDYLIEANALCFVKGRIKFVDGTTGQCKNSATFPSLVSYWGPRVQEFTNAFSSVGWTSAKK